MDQSGLVVATAAAGSDALKLLVRGVRRWGQEAETQGDVGGRGIQRTLANPQRQESGAGLVRLAFTPTARYRAELGWAGSRACATWTPTCCRAWCTAPSAT